MARISEEEINAVRNQADIVNVISHYLQVHRKGKDYVCLCPFHDDHSPSMSISPDRQIYKCFVCGNGGNVFTFVQNYEKISFPEAVGKVAELTGYHLSVQPDAYERPKDPHKEALYSLLNESINYTMYQIDTPSASRCKEYLDKRGLNSEVRKTFQIGYNPIGSSLSEFLKAKGYAEKDLVSANVSRINDSGIHDVFEDRITFPIHDEHGNPIGFSARSMDPQNPSKYINTNDTDIFTKGDIVYNYHRARYSARKEGKVYVCEGVTDVIAFQRAGLENAVCTLGTSCTAHQIQLLKNIAPKTIFCYDGDHAGQAATWRAAKMAQQAGCNVAVVLNRTGKDPDEIIRDQGSEALKDLVSHEISWMEFVLNYLQSSTNMESYLEKKEMVQKAMDEIKMLKDPMDQKYFVDELSKLTGFSLTYSQPVQPIETNTAETKKLSSVPDGVQQAQEQILCMMMNSPSAVKRFEDRLGYLISKDEQTLAMMIVDAVHGHGRTDPSELIDQTDSQKIKDLISNLASGPYASRTYDEEVMDGAIRKIKTKILSNEAEEYRTQLTAAMNDSSFEILMTKYSKCLRELRRLIDEEDSKQDQQ
ncbi:MAG: DNA primase [Solobacterium sp.]|jgi:DNA primase|nr:DNA primase [Solobacterium sp.]MCH4205244.1 DNA primase [Solobacterium sp.]MCH4226837.1 DNA primase [Solobacterium sp.]MCH4281597.1 DNA primase [Solobacterium sp.]